MYGSFYGWYFKCQSGTQTFAIIPAVHQEGKKRTCSIQLITEDDTWTISYPFESFRKKGNNILIGENRFGAKGLRLAVNTPELTVTGNLKFGPLSPLKYDIMGPFALVPFLECRHSVWSMKHSVCGSVCINRQEFTFQNGWGYWEGDRGRSFPKEYLWTQSCFPNGSIMLSVADIPIAGLRFTGIIGIVLWRGKEYRLATYLGARAVQLKGKRIRIVQGRLKLEVRLLQENGRPLKAPARGVMSRTIHESASCKVFYRFQRGKDTLFSFQTDRASFEYEYE